MTEIIEVAVSSAQRAQDILHDLGVDFTQPSTTEFVVDDEDEWNDAMEEFENQGIELV